MQTSRRAYCGILMFVLLACVPMAHASSLYDESVTGDLSDMGLSPTQLSFSAGSNRVLGTTGRGTIVDRDYFTFSVPVGYALASLTVLPGTTSAGVSFIGLEAGSTLTLPTNASVANGLLGYTLYGPANINTDILPTMAVPANGSSGFTTPLGSGNYSVWIQELTAGSYSYGFDFALAPATAVPEPASAAVVAGGIAGLFFLRFRRTRS